MLAPPQRRKRKPIAVRRADAHRRKRLQLQREALKLCRLELWISTRAYHGLARQFVATKQLTDEQANDRRRVMEALAAMVEAQGGKWAI
jgi:hypothetical protein